MTTADAPTLKERQLRSEQKALEYLDQEILRLQVRRANQVAVIEAMKEALK